MAAQKTAQDVMDGEDAIVNSMKRFANDAKCVEYLQGFKNETEAKLGSYKKALVLQMKHEMSERAVKQLQAVSSFEASMGSAMQELVVRETAASFRDKYPNSQDMQDLAFDAALKGLAGDAISPEEDPVTAHFQKAFDSLNGVDLLTVQGDANGTLPERVAYAQQAKEQEFQRTYMVSSAEAEEVRSIAGSDISKLSQDAIARLNTLYNTINAKVGFSLPETLQTKAVAQSDDAEANAYAEKVNNQLQAAQKELQRARLEAFAKSFA